jgi:beta-galactosidase
MPDAAGLDLVVGAVLEASGVGPVLPGAPPRVEAARRGDLVTVINHGDEPAEVELWGVDAESGAPLGRRALAPQEVVFALAPAPDARGKG